MALVRLRLGTWCSQERSWTRQRPLVARPREPISEVFLGPQCLWIPGPKCGGRVQRKLKRTREARRMDKKPKKKPNLASTAPSRWRAARPPFLNMEVFVGGAPARPRRGARTTPFRNAQDKDLTRPRDGGDASARRRQNSLK
ncbi:hypothetical protein PIB30_102333 [Stylosanthes scabra]|uniref:Uncharacterized protein n=1 Tax=Stylosanthes scabra TaxID=79078 RepID=A0ABU6TX82_9FABA|nr:hypothetical protein [Stylosanthes scabra]